MKERESGEKMSFLCCICSYWCDSKEERRRRRWKESESFPSLHRILGIAKQEAGERDRERVLFMLAAVEVAS